MLPEESYLNREFVRPSYVGQFAVAVMPAVKEKAEDLRDVTESDDSSDEDDREAAPRKRWGR
jgi:hypothetical protein